MLGIFGGDQTPAAACRRGRLGTRGRGRRREETQADRFHPESAEKGPRCPRGGESDPTDGPVSERKRVAEAGGWVVAALAGGAVYFKLRRPSDS